DQPLSPSRQTNHVRSHRRSTLELVNVDNRLCESLQRFLRKVVADAALDQPVLVPAGELAGVGLRVGMGRAIGVALHRDAGHADDGRLGELGLQVLYFDSPWARPSRQR